MRIGLVSTLLIAATLLVSFTGVSSAQQLVKVRDVLANPQGYLNEVITVEGLATQWVESTATTTSFYVLKDDWGGVLKVRTSRGRPETNTRYRVTGPVGIDPVSHDPYVSEETRILVAGAEGGAAPPPVETGKKVAALSTNAILLIAAIVVALGLLVGLLVWLSKSRGGTPEPVVGGGQSGTPGLPPPTMLEGRTIKIAAPPPGTLKFLPGRLEVAGGDDTVKEIRFYGLKGQSTPEMTFGRAAGAPYTHVELKAMTVSRRQAKMTYINGQWIVTNFATQESNPTVLNGAPMPIDGQAALKEGDAVEMGEVKFVFHTA